MTPRTVTYRLEVSHLDSTKDFLFNVESKTPFGSLMEGDLFKKENVAGFSVLCARGVRIDQLTTDHSLRWKPPPAGPNPFALTSTVASASSNQLYNAPDLG